MVDRHLLEAAGVLLFQRKTFLSYEHVKWEPIRSKSNRFVVLPYRPEPCGVWKHAGIAGRLSHCRRHLQGRSLVPFADNVFIRTEEQEIWAEDVRYSGITIPGYYGETWVRDTAGPCAGGQAGFPKGTVWGQVTEDPVFITWEIDRETGKTDTLFMRADTLRIFTSTYGDMDSLERVRAFERQDIPERKKPQGPTDTLVSPDSTSIPAADPGKIQESASPKAVKDTVTDPTSIAAASYFRADSADIQSFLAKTDSMLHAAVQHLGDSHFNTMEVHFFYGYKNVKVYKSDLQSVCDSMVFNSIDSVLRQYGRPVLWNEESQLSADSIQFRFSRDSLYRVDLLSKAFLISQEEVTFPPDQIGYHVRPYTWQRHLPVRCRQKRKGPLLHTGRQYHHVLNIKECEEMSVMLKDRRAERITYKKSVKAI